MIIDVNIRGSWVKEYTWEIPVLSWQLLCKSKSISKCYLCSWYSWCLSCLNSGNTIHRLLPRSVIATGWFGNSGGAPKPWHQTSYSLPDKWKDNDQWRLPKAWGRRDYGSHECQLPLFLCESLEPPAYGCFRVTGQPGLGIWLRSLCCFWVPERQGVEPLPPPIWYPEEFAQ